MGFTVEIWGEYACFSRPELKVERVSYDVLTPSAARGILEAIFWKPAIKYLIDEIQVCAPIRFENIRRNEVKSKMKHNAIPGKDFIDTNSDRAQRAALILKNVRYVVKAHFEPVHAKLGEGDKLADGSFNHGKFAETINRRLRKGQCYHTPYLGTREFPANIRLIEEDASGSEPINENRDLGFMLYDLDYEKDESGNVIAFTPTYFKAEMKNGIIDLRNVEVLR